MNEDDIPITSLEGKQEIKYIYAEHITYDKNKTMWIAVAHGTTPTRNNVVVKVEIYLKKRTKHKRALRVAKEFFYERLNKIKPDLFFVPTDISAFIP